MKIESNHEEILNELYNLVLSPRTRDWERSLLLSAKEKIESGGNFNQALAQLEYDLRPLAVRNNLTPDVTDFYLKITGDVNSSDKFDLSSHYAKDQAYEERAIFAGGCFWCMVEPFETQTGIVSVLSGYTGGHTKNPTYEQVSGGTADTGHVEAVEIIFDSRVISYEELVALYWQITDPTDEFGQFNDRGKNYRPIIFVQNEQQRKIAETSKQKLTDSGQYDRPIVTEIKAASTFWPAENFHQQFYKKNPKRYKLIKKERQQFLAFQHLQGKIRLGLKRWTKKS